MAVTASGLAAIHGTLGPLAGGTPTRVTDDPSHYHFLHGVSPDGETLAYVELPRGGMSAPADSR